MGCVWGGVGVGRGDIKVIKVPALHCKQKCLCLIKTLLLVEDRNYLMGEKQPGPISKSKIGTDLCFLFHLYQEFVN